MVQFSNSSQEDHEERPTSAVKMPQTFSSDEPVNGSASLKRKSDTDGGMESKKKKKKSKGDKSSKLNGPKSHSKRRHSVSKPARDPRDEASPDRPELEIETRSPSPVIDFDGLSRPSRHQFFHFMDITDHAKVEELVNAKKKPQNKLLLVCKSYQELLKLSSNASAKIQSVKDYLEHRNDMPKLCCSLQRATRRTFETL